MTGFESRNEWRDQAGTWSLLLALGSAIATYAVLHAFFHWDGVELMVPMNSFGGAASGPSLLLQYGLYAGLPLAFGIAGWYANSIRGFLLVSGASSLAAGMASFVKSLDQMEMFTAYGASVTAVTAAVATLVAISVGMVPPLAIALVRTWSVGVIATPAPDSGKARRKVVDARFITGSADAQAIEQQTAPSSFAPIPAPLRLLIAGAAGYAVTRVFYARWHDTSYYDLRSVSREGQMWQEMLLFLLLPLAIALILQPLSSGRIEVLGTAAVAALACAYVAARQVLLLGVDMSGDWYAAIIARSLTWSFASGMILPWIVSRVAPASLPGRPRVHGAAPP